MNRKDFLRGCVGSACSCAAMGLFATGDAAAEDAKAAEDWRLPFVKKRYARLIEILAGKLEEPALNEILRELGYSCAGGYWLINKHKGDVDGFIREFKEHTREEISYDREKGVVTVVSPERTECTCPLIGKGITSSRVCNCSLGWQQYAYETFLGKKVRVELTESVLRGGKRCCFRINVLG